MERSLRSLPPATSSPSLVFTHGKNFRDQTFCTLFDQGCHERSVPEMRKMICVAICHGWLVLTGRDDDSTRECYLFNTVTLAKIRLPYVLHSSFSVGALTSTPSDPNCFVVLYSEKKRSIIFCRIGGGEWIEQVMTRDKKKRRRMIKGPCDAISCNGKIYLSFRRYMAVVDIRDTFATIELHENRFIRPSLREIMYWEPTIRSDFLVESCGAIYKVIASHQGKFTEIIRRFDVLKLDFETMDWVNVYNIGERIFLLGRTSISLSTDGLGAKGNHIYLTVPRRTMLYMFDMDDGTITTTQPLPKSLPHWGGCFWVVPDCKLEMIKDVVSCDGEVNIMDQTWGKLLSELLDLILSSLSLGDCMRFRLTCKSWARITPSVRLNPHPFLHPNPEQLPWLMSSSNMNKDVFTFYHPIYGDAYRMRFPQLEGAIIRNVKYGWLLMSRGDRSIFFFNLLTSETIQLPDLDEPYSFLGITFSAPPTSSECIVFGQTTHYQNEVGILIYYKGDIPNEWYSLGFMNKEAYGFLASKCSSVLYSGNFVASNCNPVLYNGRFYCLSKDGKLGVFNPDRESEDNSAWKVLSVPPIFPYTNSAVKTYLIESNDELLSVFVDFRGKPIWVYKLDLSEVENMKWVRLENLGDKILFLSHATSLLLPAGLKGVSDRVYFPSFHDENNMFYSLSTGRYSCFKCIICGGDCKSASEHSNCTWIQFTI